ncbi:unnamed protein product, partial [Polarella glacialis]
SKVQMSLRKETIEGFRLCKISGQLEEVLLAEKLVQEQVEEFLSAEIDKSGQEHSWQAKHQETQMETKMLVPARRAGDVIGKEGSELKRIRESCGVGLQVLHQEETPHCPGERVVILKGGLAARQAALASVLQLAFPPGSRSAVELRLLVLRKDARALIGQQGRNLKAIRDHCGVEVKVDADEVQGERLVTATGPLHDILAASTLVLESWLPASRAALEAKAGGESPAVPAAEVAA